VTPFSLLKVKRRFVETYRLHLQCRRINQARNQHEAVANRPPLKRQSYQATYEDLFSCIMYVIWSIINLLLNKILRIIFIPATSYNLYCSFHHDNLSITIINQKLISPNYEPHFSPCLSGYSSLFRTAMYHYTWKCTMLPTHVLLYNGCESKCRISD
jgi:hypothetical protein